MYHLADFVTIPAFFVPYNIFNYVQFVFLIVYVDNKLLIAFSEFVTICLQNIKPSLKAIMIHIL